MLTNYSVVIKYGDNMTTTLKQLGQTRPANTTAVSIYSPASNIDSLVKSIVICNTSGAAAVARIFHDDNGTTFDETTALAWDLDIPIDGVVVLELFVAMADDTGNLAVRTSVNDALTFTVYGSEQS